MIELAVILVALLLDRVFGEPARWHPLVGFGRYAQRLESLLYRQKRVCGVLAVALAVAPPVIVLIVLQTALHFPLIDGIVLYFAIGWRSLQQHAQRVADALDSQDLAAARNAVGMIVSRDTRALSAQDTAKATVESVLENGNDAVFGALFWFAIFGAPGALLYRLANTLDAMWGYKNTRYLHFGWAAARLDDVLNFIPARLTALSYSLAGRTREALACWHTQAPHWKSPNAGPVMAAGAGSLGVSLGGAAIYHGELQHRPPLGIGRHPDTRDIDASLQLLRRALWWWLCALAAIKIGIAYHA